MCLRNGGQDLQIHARSLKLLVLTKTSYLSCFPAHGHKLKLKGHSLRIAILRIKEVAWKIWGFWIPTHTKYIKMPQNGLSLMLSPDMFFLYALKWIGMQSSQHDSTASMSREMKVCSVSYLVGQPTYYFPRERQNTSSLTLLAHDFLDCCICTLRWLGFPFQTSGHRLQKVVQLELDISQPLCAA